jgi:hypothetical protein
VGLLIGEGIFVKVLHISGWKPIFNPMVLAPTGVSGGGFNQGHVAWDVLVGLVGGLIVFLPIRLVSKLAG